MQILIIVYLNGTSALENPYINLKTFKKEH